MTLSPPAPYAVAPSPPQDAASSRVNASAGRRAGAYLIDFAIVAAVGVVVWLLTGSLPLVAVAVIELWAIGWVWEGHIGATPGNLICGIRTVRRDSLLSVGAPRLLPRSVLLGLANVIPVLLPLGLAASGALDGVSGARMIDVKKARQAAGAGLGGAPSLEARVRGRGTAESPVESAPSQGLITETPGSATVAIAQEPVSVPAAVPAAEPYIPSGAASVSIFELSDGEVIRATGLGFVGRAPRAPESVSEAILVRVPDGARSLSRTHASFGVEDDQLWVQDLGSANGASVHHLGGAVTDLVPHTPFFLVPGDVLVLGGEAKLAYRRVVDRSQPAGRDAGPTVVQAAAPSSAAPSSAAASPASVAPTAAAPAAATRAEARAQARSGGGVPVATATPPGLTPAPAAEPAREASPVPTTAPDAGPVALQFSDGTTIPIVGPGYVGRAPSLPDGESADAALIAVPGGDRSVSRTHGRFGVLQGRTWFEDLGSGNGSSLRTSDGRSGTMTAHQRFTLVPGMVLLLGDCTIHVVSA